MKSSTSNQRTLNETHHTVETFIEAFKNELQKEEHVRKLPENNLTKNEIQALKDLSIRDDIIITEADKGGAAVIIDADDYINEVNQQLNNKEFYKEIPDDPIEFNRKKVKKMQSKN